MTKEATVAGKMIPSETTIKAICWRVDAPNKRLQGEFTYGPTSGAEIDLFGHLYDEFDDKKLVERFTLHGQTFKAKPFSLFNCLVHGGEIHLPGGRSCKVSSVSGIVGGHYSALDEVRFKKIEASFRWLREWVCTSGISLKPEEAPQGATVTYRVPETISLGRIGVFALQIEFRGHFQPDFHSLYIDEDCLLVIEADEMQPYTAFEEHIHAFQRLLSLAVQRPAYSLHITGYLEKPRETVNDTPIFDELFVVRKLTTPDSKREKLIPHEQLFTLHEIVGSPALVYARFIERQEKLRASMDLYFSNLYRQSRLPRVEFLTLAQSLEAYHRATVPGRYMGDETYRAGLREKLWEVVSNCAEVPADFRRSLSNKLDYLHEFSLRKRLKDILTKHAPILEQLIGSAEDFSVIVSDLRNKLTHAGEESTEAERDHKKLLRLSEQMALLIEVCLLDEIGFTQKRIREMIIHRSQRAYRIHCGWV